MTDKGLDDLNSTTNTSKNKSVDGDHELDELLDSALEDFDKPVEVASAPSKSGTALPDLESPINPVWNEEFLMEAQKQFEENLKVFMSGDEESLDPEKFSEQLQKMAKEANKYFAQESGDPEFTSTIADTLKSLTENSENLQAELNETDLSTLLNGLGLGGSEAGPDILPFMQNMMSCVLSKDVLYPSIKEVVDKFPTWLEENKSTLSEKDYENYLKQCELMKKVCLEFEKETSFDTEEVKRARLNTILFLMEDIQKIGQPPKELVGTDTPFSFDDKGMPSPLPGMDPAQCSIM